MEHQQHFGRKFYLDKKTGYWISTDHSRVRAQKTVELHLLGINMLSNDFALESAPIIGKRIKSIKKMDVLEDVYCLTAINNSNFIANGIITHNCDATRYALASHKVSYFDQDEYNRKLEQQMRSRMHPGGFR